MGKPQQNNSNNRNNTRSEILTTAFFAVLVNSLVFFLRFAKLQSNHDFLSFSSPFEGDQPSTRQDSSTNSHAFSPLKETMTEGCRTWKGPLPSIQAETLLSKPPTGLVVTMLHGKMSQDYVCDLFASQLVHFLQPQGIDQLLIMPAGEDAVPKMSDILDCLQLNNHPQQPNVKNWKNLDGSTLTTYEYTYDFFMRANITTTTSATSSSQQSIRPVSVFVAQSDIQLPTYVRQDRSILTRPIDPKHCQASVDYIQGTRWYIYEMFHLAILQEYDYWLKIDTDVAFVRSIPVALLHDMTVRGAVFGHTGQYLEHFKLPCGEESIECLNDFRRHYKTHKQQSRDIISTGMSSVVDATDSNAWIATSEWNGTICSAAHPKMYSPHDRYYSNLIIGRTDYFQSPEVRGLGRYMSEYPSGFFKHRWGDQIFYHFAVGMFIGPDFEAIVADYTEFRCFPNPKCWWSVFDSKVFHDSHGRCDNGGSFLHTKARGRHKIDWETVKEIMSSNWTAVKDDASGQGFRMIPPALERATVPYEINYKSECPAHY